MQKIAVGVIGLGFIGKQHIEALRRVPGIEVAAASDADASMRNWCQANGIENFYVNYQDMLKKVKLELYMTARRIICILEVNKAILESGRHVYSEKPLTRVRRRRWSFAGLQKRRTGLRQLTLITEITRWYRK